MPENNQMMSVQGQIVGMPLAGPESFSQQQLEYLKRALGVDETVLYDANLPALNGTITLSEPWSNFKYIEVSYKHTDTPSITKYKTEYFHPDRVAFHIGFAVNYMSQAFIKFTPTSDNKVWTYAANTAYQLKNTGTSWTITQNDTSYITSSNELRIVGIGRISGGNQ